MKLIQDKGRLVVKEKAYFDLEVKIWIENIPSTRGIDPFNRAYDTRH